MRICNSKKNIDGMRLWKDFDKNKESNLILKHGGL